MLVGPNEVQGDRAGISKEARLLGTVMFREAPKNIIKHFLAQVPDGFKLDQGHTRSLMRVKKYSEGLCKKLIERRDEACREFPVAVLDSRPCVCDSFPTLYSSPF